MLVLPSSYDQFDGFGHNGLLESLSIRRDFVLIPYPCPVRLVPAFPYRGNSPECGVTPKLCRTDAIGTVRQWRKHHCQIPLTDPLPLLSVQINGGPEVTFFIDTGGSTVALDADFAKELGVPQLGRI